MKPTFKRRALASKLALICSAGMLSACGGGDDPVPAPVGANDAALKFDASNYTTVNITVDGVAMKVRQYKVVYVAKPIKMASTLTTQSTVTLESPYALQMMNISVPESKINDQKTAIFFAVSNGGWFASPMKSTIAEGKAFASVNTTGVMNPTDTYHYGAALKAGYIVIDVGTRSRGARAEDGSWAGKAPAPVVDAKAAIRYLRLNDDVMPGSAERIVVNGTSGGGGLTAAIGASGNSADYLPFLAEIGAAGVAGSGSAAVSTIKDDIFAAVAYCPINNLGNADAGYEWEYNAVRTDSNTGALGGVAYSAGPQPAASLAIASTFPAYVSSLGLKLDDGTPLTTDNLRSATEALLRAELQRQIAAGTAVPQLGQNFVPPRGRTLVNDWLTLSGTGTGATITSLDYTKYLRYVAANQSLKTVVAFDAVGVNGNRNATTGALNITGESTLFGSPYFQYSNFTDWSWTNNAVVGDGSGKDDYNQTWAQYLASPSNNLATQLKLINPVAYLNTAADAAPYWYVRHGMIDRDTAFAMQTLLYYAIKNDPTVKDVNYKMPYLIPHDGNYDVPEAFAWIKAKLDANP